MFEDLQKYISLGIFSELLFTYSVYRACESTFIASMLLYEDLIAWV